ncbi:MAG: tRNA pseudouridine(55) synthase TruB [Aquificae bacterium]|nr:tRNA pseudouridine(55) synthase TruB [Aquificota bacterium]
MDGILLIDKPENITSNHLVQKIKKATGIQKIGHTGTLDYFASGLMVLTVGQGTKLTQYFQGLDKEYTATGELGKETDTYDIMGKVVKQSPCNTSEEKVREAILSFKGEYSQMPPPYSSKRVGGTRAYKLAKKGIQPPLKPKLVKVYSIQINSVNLPFFTITVSCSSGTYIRSLIKDIGDRLGCGAYTVSLRRTKVGDFDVSQAVPFEEVVNRKAVEEMIIPLREALYFFPEVVLDEGFDKRFSFGQRFKIPYQIAGLVKVVSKEGILLGIGRVDDNQILHPVRVLSGIGV